MYARFPLSARKTLMKIAGAAILRGAQRHELGHVEPVFRPASRQAERWRRDEIHPRSSLLMVVSEFTHLRADQSRRRSRWQTASGILRRVGQTRRPRTREDDGGRRGF